MVSNRKTPLIGIWGAWYSSKNVGDQAILISIINLIKKYNLETDVILQSLSGKIIKTFYELEPDLTYCIFRAYLGKEFIPHRIFNPIFYKRLIKKLPVKYISLDGPFMYDAFVKRLNNDGYKIILGARRLEKNLKNVNKWNIDIVNCNDPGKIRELMNNL